jgi:hypothetical protein
MDYEEEERRYRQVCEGFHTLLGRLAIEHSLFCVNKTPSYELTHAEFNISANKKCQPNLRVDLNMDTLQVKACLWAKIPDGGKQRLREEILSLSAPDLMERLSHLVEQLASLCKSHNARHSDSSIKF